MKIKVMLFTLCCSVFLVLSLQLQAFAAPTVEAKDSDINHKGCRQKLEEMAKQKGVTVDELKAQLKAEHEKKLQERAKEEGISVEELKARLEAKKAEREKKLEEMAKAKGITVEQLKAQLKAEHEKKLEEMAKQKGITVDELKKQMRDKRREGRKPENKK